MRNNRGTVGFHEGGDWRGISGVSCVVFSEGVGRGYMRWAFGAGLKWGARIEVPAYLVVYLR